jgi:molecular chaperone GrpE
MALRAEMEEKKEEREPGAEKREAARVELTPEEFESFQAKAKELEVWKDKFLRAAADFDNAKKRLAKEREEFVRLKVESLVRGLLPIVDNFERALAHLAVPEDKDAEALKSGIVLIKNQFVAFLTHHGISRMHAAGKKFDPHFHEAIAHVESDEHPDETVIEELEPGYLWHGRLLRPAKVRVSRMPGEKPASTQ